MPTASVYYSLISCPLYFKLDHNCEIRKWKTGEAGKISTQVVLKHNRTGTACPCLHQLRPTDGAHHLFLERCRVHCLLGAIGVLHVLTPLSGGYFCHQLLRVPVYLTLFFSMFPRINFLDATMLALGTAFFILHFCPFIQHPIESDVKKV